MKRLLALLLFPICSLAQVVNPPAGGGGSTPPSIAGTIQGANPTASGFISSNEIIGTTAAGFANPTAAITAACSSNSKAVYFPAALYTSGIPLLCSGLHIRCAAAGVLQVASGSVFQITGANWGMYNPNADVTSPGQAIENVTVDNCVFDISTDPTNVLGAWRIKGILSSHFNNNQIISDNNTNPAITEDGSNFANNAGDYDNTFVGNNMWDIGGVNTNGVGYKLIGSSNNNSHYGGSINRYGTDVYIQFGNNNIFHGIDGENWQQYCIRMDSANAGGNKFDRFRCESGLGPWFPNQAQAAPLQLIDSNGNREIVTVSGTSGGTVPTWCTTLSCTTTSGTVTYTLNRLLPTDVLATGSAGNSIDYYFSGYQTGVVDTTGLNTYPFPISQGAPAAGGLQQTFSAWSNSVKQTNMYGNTNQQDTSSVYSGGCADGYHFGCFHMSGINGGEIQASRAFLLCNQTTGVGCTGYVNLITNAAQAQTVTIPDNAGVASSVLISGQNVTLTATGQATAPTPNFGSKSLILTGSYYTGQLAFGRYLSGGTFTGTGVCNVDTFNNSSTATATLPVTSGAIPVNTPLTLISVGTGATAPPTTAVMNGTCTGGATASGTINLTNVSLGAGIANYSLFLNAPTGTISNPGVSLSLLPNGTTSLANSFIFDDTDLLLFNVNAATVGANQPANKIAFRGSAWNGSISNSDMWSITPTLAAGSNPASTLTIAHTGPGTGTLALPAGTTCGGTPCQTSGALSGTTGSIGGGALTAGTCATGTATVTGALTSQVATASPNTYPGDPFGWRAQVTSANTVTVYVCTNLATGGTPSAGTYNVRVQ